MTGTRHFAKEAERRQREAVRQAQRERGCEFSACQHLTRFIVRAPQAVVVEILDMALEASRSLRPWFSQGAGPTDDGLFGATFYAGPEDAARVRKLLRDRGISEVHR